MITKTLGCGPARCFFLFLLVGALGCVGVNPDWMRFAAPSPRPAGPQAFATRPGVGCGAPFAPSKRVAGRRVALPGTEVSVTIPSGWSGRPQTAANGSPAFLLTAPAAGPSGTIVLASADEPSRTLPEMAKQVADELAGAEDGKVVASRDFSLGQGCGGQWIFRTSRLEGYVALVRRGVRVYVVAAKYPIVAARAMRAGLDTIVASAALPPPVAPGSGSTGAVARGGATGGLPGCWEVSDANSTRRYNFQADQTYSLATSFSGLGYVGPSEDAGRYRLDGGSLVLFPSAGGSSTYDVSITEDRLSLGSTHFFRCD